MTLIEIEKADIIRQVTCHRPGIWQFVVYETGSFFPWFSEGKLKRNIVKVGSLTINNINYTNAAGITSEDQLPQLPENYFCQIGNTVYVRNHDNNPLWLYDSRQFNVVLGFTDDKPTVLNGVYYKSGLDYVPKISDQADNLEYGRMTFKNENLELINAKGDYDDVVDYFGNNIRVRSEVGGQLKNLYEYYIKNVKIKAEKTTFICGDRREKLAQQLPNGRFTLETYPKMKKELEGEFRQDVYGKCGWVKCVCVDELDIYEDEEEKIRKTYRTFYAARKITKLELIDKSGQLEQNYVWVKQTQPENQGEIWTPCPCLDIDEEKGEFTLDITHCMPPWTGDNVPEVYEVRASGVFWAPDGRQEARPLDIIKELLRHYCGVPYNEYTFNQTEIEAEIGGLAPVGIVFDRDMGVFEAIETLQNAGDYGFRFMTDYNRFTARKDNNERNISAAIKIIDIVDIADVEIDMNRENYATIIDLAYSRNYYYETAKHAEESGNRQKLLNIHGVDKVYALETCLTEESAARNRAKRLERFFSKTRPAINNIKVINHPFLRVYDIVTVDLRIPIERKGELRQVAMLFGGSRREAVVFGDWPGEKISVDFGTEEQPQHRMFGGVLTCKVMSVSLDTGTMVNTISLLEVG